MSVHDDLGKRTKEYYEQIPKTRLMQGRMNIQEAIEILEQMKSTFQKDEWMEKDVMALDMAIDAMLYKIREDGIMELIDFKITHISAVPENEKWYAKGSNVMFPGNRRGDLNE